MGRVTTARWQRVVVKQREVVVDGFLDVSGKFWSFSGYPEEEEGK